LLAGSAWCSTEQNPSAALSWYSLRLPPLS